MSNASRVRQRLDSGGPWEDAFGYSRAVRIGDRIVVSGCTAVMDGTVQHPGDAGAQMRLALDRVRDAVEALGGILGDVIHTRMYVVHRADCETVGRVHGERFSDVRPAATMVLVAGLLDEQMLVEVEAEAWVGSAEAVRTRTDDRLDPDDHVDPGNRLDPDDHVDPGNRLDLDDSGRVS